jgi:hypothetical protein
MDRVPEKLTKNSLVVGIIIKALTNKKANHEPKFMEWGDGSRSNLVYVPKSGKGLRPIIIEFQDVVDDKSMKSQVDSCLQAAEKYDMEPILLVICTEKVDDSLRKNEHKRIPCYDIPCLPWAFKCFILVQYSTSGHVEAVDEDDHIGEHCTVYELDPFAAYAIVITGHVFEQ